MLPIQILLNNCCCATPEIAIPFDLVHPEDTTRPVKWDVKLIEQFMLVFGPVTPPRFSDLLRSAAYCFGAGEALFQTRLVYKSITTQVLVVFAIPYATAILPKQTEQVPAHHGAWQCRRRNSSAASTGRPLTEFDDAPPLFFAVRQERQLHIWRSSKLQKAFSTAPRAGRLPQSTMEIDLG